MNILEKLSKEDLIRIIANMHDTIQEWDNGYGLPKEDAETLIKIGRACTTYCVKTNFDLNVVGDMFSSEKLEQAIRTE
jgi:hypothetical protein